MVEEALLALRDCLLAIEALCFAGGAEAFAVLRGDAAARGGAGSTGGA
jgi:hypothetical protein